MFLLKSLFMLEYKKMIFIIYITLYVTKPMSKARAF